MLLTYDGVEGCQGAQPRRIDIIDRVISNIGIQVAVAAIEADGVFLQPASGRRVVLARPKMGQAGALVI